MECCLILYTYNLDYFHSTYGIHYSNYFFFFQNQLLTLKKEKVL